MRDKASLTKGQGAADRDLALRAFVHVAADAELVAALLAAAGAAPSDLRAMARRPEFAGFILDFLLESDERLLGFAAAEGIAPEAVHRARLRLDGNG